MVDEKTPYDAPDARRADTAVNPAACVYWKKDGGDGPAKYMSRRWSALIVRRGSVRLRRLNHQQPSADRNHQQTTTGVKATPSQ
jgi:hypothetical protein